ncbi:MAG: thermonuclease family protein [Anaerolineae bacterium]|nr:thermonuclease family protein [Anaerolineae bacterium]
MQFKTNWIGMSVIVLLLVACNDTIIEDTTPSSEDELGVVVGIIDGDTIDVAIGAGTYRVRYIGINTPELDEPCSAEATAANTMLVSGQTVRLAKDVSETDRYERLLRYVYIGETFVNAELVKQGWAEAVAYPPDLAHAAFFSDQEDAARLQNLGCWPSGVFDAQ